jgi:hypothetical protein
MHSLKCLITIYCDLDVPTDHNWLRKIFSFRSIVIIPLSYAGLEWSIERKIELG